MLLDVLHRESLHNVMKFFLKITLQQSHKRSVGLSEEHVGTCLEIDESKGFHESQATFEVS